MFGIGFTELLLIAIVAILFLGPDKLPETMMQIAKFFKSVKKTINEAKSALDEEMRIADLKEEALQYKQQLEKTTHELQGFKNISLDEILDEPVTIGDKTGHPPSKPAADTPAETEEKQETVTFKKGNTVSDEHKEGSA